MLWLVVVTWGPRGRQLWREWSAGDGSVGLDPAGGEGELHEPLAEGPNMALLQILQPIVLVYLPCSAHSLHRGAALRAHLGTGHPGDIESGTHRGRERRLLGLVVLLLRLRRRVATKIL